MFYVLCDSNGPGAEGTKERRIYVIYYLLFTYYSKTHKSGGARSGLDGSGPPDIAAYTAQAKARKRGGCICLASRPVSTAIAFTMRLSW